MREKHLIDPEEIVSGHEDAGLKFTIGVTVVLVAIIIIAAEFSGVADHFVEWLATFITGYAG